LVVDDNTRLMALVGEIYDAALEPAKWVGVLADTARFVGGPAASVHSKAIAQRSSEIYFQSGLDPDYERLYIDQYVKIDPSTRIELTADVGDIISTETYMPHDEFKQTRFYREWAYPQRIVDGATAVLQKTPTAVAMFTVFRDQRDGLVNDAMRERMQRLAPHVRRAVMIGKLIDATQSRAIAFADTIDGLSAGVFLVDRNGDLIHANAEARALLSAGDVLSAVNARLLAHDPAVNGLLRNALVDVGDHTSAGKGVSLPLTTRDGDDYIVNALPLKSGANRHRRTSAASAAIFISKAGLAIRPSPHLIAQRYKLTPTELRVLLAIVEIGGVPDVADALGVSVTTVKTHLERIYEKTGVNRQADLARLVAGFASPVAGGQPLPSRMHQPSKRAPQRHLRKKR
jgi:DNA-binding CsgD family transcriptional regulator